MDKSSIEIEHVVSFSNEKLYSDKYYINVNYSDILGGGPYFRSFHLSPDEMKELKEKLSKLEIKIN